MVVKKERSMNLSVLLHIHSAAGLSGMSSVADDSVVCPPTWCNAPQVHISLNIGFLWQSTKCFFFVCYCFVAFLLFWSLAVATNILSVDKSISVSIAITFLIRICIWCDIKIGLNPKNSNIRAKNCNTVRHNTVYSYVISLSVL